MVRTLFAVVALVLVHAAAAQQSTPIPAELGARVAHDFIEPTVLDLMQATINERSAIYSLCDEPSQEALEAARAEFGGLVSAWGRMSVLRFGPLHHENRFERFFYWPDPRGVILRQVQEVLASQDLEVTRPETIAGKSVAVQGLPALEFLLFGAGSEELATPDSAFRCAYARGIIDNTLFMAEEMAENWREVTSYVDSFVEPAADKNPYRSNAEVAAELLKAMGTALQFARAAELSPALGDGIEDARGKRVPFWRSDQTFTLVNGQMDGLLGFVDATGLGTSADPLTRDLIESFVFELSNARAALAKLTSPAELAFADVTDRDRIVYATIALEGAEKLLSERLAAAIGLTMGFNALDGD